MSNVQRLGESIGNVNQIGIIIGISVLFSQYFILFQKKYLYLFPAIICIIMVLTTGSRVAIVLVAFSSLILLYFYRKDSFKGRIKSIIIGIFVLLMFYYLLFNIPYFYQVAGHRLENILLFFKNEEVDEGSIILRTFMIKFGLELFKDRPFIGYGIDNYRVLLGEEINVMTYAHNNYIELLVDLGLFGTIIYYLIYVNAFIRLLKSNKYFNLRYLFFTFLLTVTVIDFASVNYYSKHILIILAMCSIFADLEIKMANSC